MAPYFHFPPNGRTSNMNACNLVTTNDGLFQFATWYTLAGELLVGRIERGVQRWGVDHDEHQIAGAARTELALPVAADEHNFPACVEDDQGKLHVWANMHNSVNRHIVTTNAARTDITAWTVPAAMPSETDRNTYPTPVLFPSGKVWFYYRALQTYGLSGRANGYYWTRSAGSWSARTELFRGVPSGLEGADDDETNFSPYLAFPHLTDVGGAVPRMHLFWSWRQDPYQGSSCVLPSYAYSDDEGATYRAIDGTLLTLPISPTNNLACQTGMTSGRSRTVTDAVTNGTTTLTSATANFQPADVNKYIRGQDINNGKDPLTFAATTITARASTTSVTLSQAANGSGTGRTVTIGDDYENDPALAIDSEGRPHALQGIHPLPRLHIYHDGTAWQQTTQAKDLAGVELYNRMLPYYVRGDLWVMATGEPLNERRTSLAKADGSAVVTMGGVVYDGSTGSTQWDQMADPVAYRLFGSLEVLTPSGDTPLVASFGTGPRFNN